jgi:hypothetical protein
MLGLIVACTVLSGCVGGREHESVESTVGPWKRWEVTPSDEFGGAFTLIYINAIVPRTDTEPWTAVGYLVGPTGKRKPTAWRSRDGVSWDAEALPRSNSKARWDRPFKAAQSRGTIVAFGLRGKEGNEGVVAWHRTEDAGWSWLPGVHAYGWEIPQIVESVVATPYGFAGAGARHTDSESSIHIIRSGDGSDWTGGTYPGLSAGTAARQDAFDVAVNDELEVIVGRSWPFSPPYENKDGAIWWSSLGDPKTSWTRVPLDGLRADGPGYDAVQGIVPFGAGFVAVGIADLPDERPMAWVSADGREWSAHVIEDVTAGAADVALVGDRLVAVGLDGDGPRLGAWTSSDGRSWTRLELPDEMTRLHPLERVAVTAGPKGEIGIVASDDVQSDIYIGYP